MPYIVAYQKASDDHTTYELRGPEGDDSPVLTELCTLEGITYVAVPAGVVLPPQAPEIASTIHEVTLTHELREAIKAASPHARLISARMISMIRARYTPDDEAYLTRISVGQLSGLYQVLPGEQEEVEAFGEFVEGVREWGRAERAKLGL